MVRYGGAAAEEMLWRAEPEAEGVALGFRVGGGGGWAPHVSAFRGGHTPFWSTFARARAA